MSEELQKDLKTTADGAAGAAPAAAEAKASASGGDVAQEAEKAAGKDEGKKKDADKSMKKEEEKKKKEEEKKQKEEEKKQKEEEKKKKEEEKKKGTGKDKDKDEKTDKDGKKGKDGKKDDGSGDEKAPAAPFKIPEAAILAATIVVSLTAGSILGSLLIAPRVIAARNAQPAAPAKVEKAEGGGEAQEGEGKKGEGKKGEGKKGEGKKGEGEKSAVYSIDNIVVNPAGSAGTRFLMASVAFELADEKEVEALREKEVQIRDAVITTLESQTLEMLAAPGSRDGIKRQLALAIKPLVPGHQQLRVYLPQFVLQ